MHPQKVDRTRTVNLEDLPNIGKACAGNLRLIGIDRPEQLIGRDPFELYERLCLATGSRQDPCMIDVLMSIVAFMDGGEPQPWWAFTEARKRHYRRKTGAFAACTATNSHRTTKSTFKK